MYMQRRCALSQTVERPLKKTSKQTIKTGAKRKMLFLPVYTVLVDA